MTKRKEQIMQAVARGWCSEKNSQKTMDPDLAIAITEEIMEIWPQAEQDGGFCVNWERPEETVTAIDQLQRVVSDVATKVCLVVRGLKRIDEEKEKGTI